MRSKAAFLLVSALCLIAAACSSDVMGTSKYSALRARFKCDNVVAYPALYAACNSLGVWCTVKVASDGKRFEFSQVGGRTDYMLIPASMDEQAHLWVAGLIVGLPHTPDPGTTQSYVYCYDLACPECYKIPLDKPLSTNASGYATCEKCGNQYDLNNQGLHIKGNGEEGSLFRYRTTYMNAALIVSN